MPTQLADFGVMKSPIAISEINRLVQPIDRWWISRLCTADERTFVLYDKETGSLWYPYDDGLMGIQGIYFKRWLPKLASEDTRWQNWKQKHPNSKIMD